MQSKGRLVGLLMTVLFVGFALYRVDLAELIGVLGRVNYVWLLPSAACTLLGYVLRTWRWSVILSGAARAPLRTLFPVLVMGFATNNLLPGRLGEFWRAYLLSRKRNVRKTSALASVVVERVFDGMALVAILVLVSTRVELPGWSSQIELFAASLFVGASVFLALLLWRAALAVRLVGFVLRPAPERARRWATEAMDAFIEGIAGLRKPGVLTGATVLSMGVWLLEGASYLLLSRGIELGLAADTVLPAMGLTLVTINLGIMVPSAPGYVGTMEFFGTSALGVFGVNYESALALVLVSHAVQYLLITGLGLAFFAREHLSPRDLGVVTAMQPLEREPAG